MPIITDADVLIDYWQSDFSILGLYAARIDSVVIPSQVFDEVRQLAVAECELYALKIVEEPLQVLTQAAEQQRPLSYPDRVCLCLAKEWQLICVTNEKPLHKACRTEDLSSQ